MKPISFYQDELSALSHRLQAMVNRLRNSNIKANTPIERDPVTGLPNRQCFQNALQNHLAHCEMASSKTIKPMSKMGKIGPSHGSFN